MLNSRQRAYLRGMANSIEPVSQIGKNGINETFISQLADVLEKRELIKVTVLETAFMTTRAACEQCAELLKADTVQCIGYKFVLYKQANNVKNRKIIMPKRKK